MFRVVLILILFVFKLSFSQVNDTVGILTKTDIDEIEKVIEDSKENVGFNYEINILNSDSEIENELKKYEKSVIINLIVQEDKKYKVSISFSQDLGVISDKDSIMEILDNSEENLKNEEFSKFFKDLITEINILLTEEKTESIPKKGKLDFWIYLIVLIPILFWKKILRSFKKLKYK